MRKTIHLSNCLERYRNSLKFSLSLTLLFFALSTNAATDGVKLSLSLKATNLPSILKEIKNQMQYDFMYNSMDFDANKTISVELKNVSLDSALKVCVTPFGLSYAVKDRIIVLTKKKILPQQNQVSGFVKDEKGEPLPGVTVMLQGTTVGVASDMKGRFEISLPEGKNTLLFSFMGMKPTSREVIGGQMINVTLEEGLAELGEVVVTGMGTINKEQMTGSYGVITAKDLRAQGINSIDRILEGTIAGLNSATITGAPGRRAKITIRGENNLSGNTEPLWIVDGLPMMTGVPENSTGDYAGTIMQDGVGNIMPEEIESVTILKDAAAAAIYGAKAANGVIVITTKKGFRSKTQFNYSGNFSLAEAPRLHLDFMNSSQKIKYETDVVKVFGLSTGAVTGRGGLLYQRLQQGYITQGVYDAEIERLRNTNTNWFDEIFRKAKSQQHNVSLRGGSEEMTYYTSITFQEKTGILSGNKYTSAGALVKLDYRPIKNLIFDLNFSLNLRKNEDNASIVNPFNYAVFANTYERPYDEKGNYASDLSYLGANNTLQTASGYKYDSFNILREINENKIGQDGLDATMTFNIHYDILPGFSVQSIVRKGVSYNTTTTEMNAGTYTSLANEVLANKVFYSQDVFPSVYNNGEFKESSGKNFNWSLRNQIDYSYNIKQEHLFSVLLANEIMSKRFNNFSYTSPVYYSDYRIVGMPEFSTETTYESLRAELSNLFYTNVGQDRTVSFLGTFRYGYKDRYIFNFNYRADGADAIGENNRFAPLWSIGARYNLHRENFFKNKVVTELSLRGSFGYTGNIDRSAYPFSTMALGPNFYEGNRYSTSFVYPNPSVRWEKKQEFNYGIDLTLFGNCINFTMDGYFNRTKDVLEKLPVPVSSGRTSVRANGGIVENSGVEFYLNVRWINRDNIIFSTSGNIARNKNVIVRSQYTHDSYAAAIKSANVKGGIINIVGKETGSVYGWQRQGTDPVTGNPTYYLSENAKRSYAKFMDSWSGLDNAKKQEYIKNGMYPSFDKIPDYVPFARDYGTQPDYMRDAMQYLGRSNPKYVGGFNTYFRYKGVEFTSQWSYKLGHIITSFNDYKSAPYNGQGDLGVSGTNRETRYQSFWQAPGDNCEVARFVPTGSNDYWTGMASSDKYENGNFLRLLNVSLSYRLSSEVAKQFGMRSLSIAVNAYNLFTFTHYKGLDVGTYGAFNYPTSREYNLKLSLGF